VDALDLDTPAFYVDSISLPRCGRPSRFAKRAAAPAG
jgi:hypothetical protein